MSRELPQNVEEALEAIANGWGREPTHAHPLCVCMAEDKRAEEPTPNLPGYRVTFVRQRCPIHPKAR